MKAVINGHKDIVRMLLDAGADTSPADKVSSCLCMCACVCV
jgi:ankyrin repeat protein